MSEWKTYKIGNICTRICSGGTPKSTEPAYYGGDIPWLNTKEINFNQIYATERCITQSGFNNSSAKWIEPNSVIIAMYGATAAKVAINKIPLTTNQACCNLTINKTIADYRYIFYYLCNNYTLLASLANGGAQQNLNAQQIKDFEITLPSLEKQKRIAAILGALDDKIELNRRINANLEEQAKALYYKLCHDGCNNLDFDLSEFAEIYSGKSIKPKKSGLYPILGANGEIGRTNEFLFNDRLIYTGRVGTLGKINRVENKKVWMSDNTLIIKPNIGYNFIYFTLRDTNIHSYNVGSTQPLIRQSDIKGIKIFFPEFEILQKFEQISDTLFSQINNNNDQNTILAILRDTLLPKLMKDK